ncbi:MAG: DegT/DnrJ/EryC1/StrS family aminotransferase [Chloroherpetonaceae bacterium]|nr:DegT/DnrJ/EryC1/StrS family aminotransferase [Chloroherpetonaceae bacterium]MCS7212524.1 DegT/DnrJ/EryC1/StrS family aminotransferase [Chloroherpetonaceae bacterium]MDW8019034.1 DegT/DnrJ/EryC1/StrS family aminotransferase [Chloroherpetonaceae bacterium]
MKIPFVDLKAQYQSIKSEIDSAIANVISETAFISGKYAKAFEEEFAAYIGIKHCISCANGTDSIEILLKAMGIGHGDEVIVPANSWISTSEAVTTVGATPVFVDILPDYYTIDPSKIEEKITPRTKVIIPVHLYGLPAEMDEIMAIARKYGLRVLEDCAQSHGATYKGKMTGTFGDCASFSFYPGKNLGAYGDAGAMVTNDDEIARIARLIANHGQPRKNEHEIEGRNSRLDGIQAAVLSVKLRHLENWTEARRRNANLYRKYLSGTHVVLPKEPEYSRHVYHLFVVRVTNREKIIDTLRAEGIETGIHYPTPLPLLKAYQRFGHKPEDFPVASSQMGKILSLPMYPELTEEMIEFVAKKIESQQVEVM